MNLGVETAASFLPRLGPLSVSAFSDESWGGDQLLPGCVMPKPGVSAFSDESWGGDHQIRYF